MVVWSAVTPPIPHPHLSPGQHHHLLCGAATELREGNWPQFFCSAVASLHGEYGNDESSKLPLSESSRLCSPRKEGSTQVKDALPSGLARTAFPTGGS